MKTKTIPTVRLIGLDWETENRADHATFDEAQKIAADAGVRCPTDKELAKLSVLPADWDHEKKGIRFAETIIDLNDPEKYLFLPAVGAHNYKIGLVTGQEGYGYYWSSTPYNGPDCDALFFSREGVYPVGSSNSANGFSVRCVKI